MCKKLAINKKLQKEISMTTEHGKKGVIGVNYNLEKPVEETILYEKPEYNIAKITINRPEKHNS